MNLDTRLDTILGQFWHDKQEAQPLANQAIKQLIRDVIAETLPPRVDIPGHEWLYSKSADEGMLQHTYDRAQNAIIDQIESNLKRLLQ